MSTSTADVDGLAVEDHRPEIVYLSSARALTLTSPGETRPRLYRRGEVIPEQPVEHILGLLESRLITPIVLEQVTADVWAYTGELPAECIPGDELLDSQPDPCGKACPFTSSELEQSVEFWRHRARVAETQLAPRAPFWLARGRLRARRHTWFHRDGSAVPGYALLDNQGRLRGHLTINQARQLHKHLGRLLTEEPATPDITTEGHTHHGA